MKQEAKETPDRSIIFTICITVVALVILVIFWVKKSIENYNDFNKTFRLGKSVFLTKQEAEERLRREENELLL